MARKCTARHATVANQLAGCLLATLPGKSKSQSLRLTRRSLEERGGRKGGREGGVGWRGRESEGGGRKEEEQEESEEMIVLGPYCVPYIVGN